MANIDVDELQIRQELQIGAPPPFVELLTIFHQFSSEAVQLE